jgi:hypothetical protein
MKQKKGIDDSHIASDASARVGRNLAPCTLQQPEPLRKNHIEHHWRPAALVWGSEIGILAGSPGTGERTLCASVPAPVLGLSPVEFNLEHTSDPVLTCLHISHGYQQTASLIHPALVLLVYPRHALTLFACPARQPYRVF